MKNILRFLLVIPLFFACSSDDNSTDEIQDYTSFQIINQTKSGIYENVVIGYKTPNNTLKKIANLGDIEAGKSSKETIIDYKTIKNIMLFSGKPSDKKYSDIVIIDDNINLSENQKNIYRIPDGKIHEIKHIDVTDETQYPQD